MEIWKRRIKSNFSTQIIGVTPEPESVGNGYRTTDVAYVVHYIHDDQIECYCWHLKNARNLFAEYDYVGTVGNHCVAEIEWLGDKSTLAILVGYELDVSVPSSCITFEQYKEIQQAKLRGG